MSSAPPAGTPNYGNTREIAAVVVAGLAAVVTSNALSISDLLDDDYGNRLVTAIAFFGVYILIDRQPFKPVEIPPDASQQWYVREWVREAVLCTVLLPFVFFMFTGQVGAL